MVRFGQVWGRPCSCLLICDIAVYQLNTGIQFLPVTVKKRIIMADNKEKYFENEKLDPEQLEEVSGGSCKELSEDSRAALPSGPARISRISILSTARRSAD